MPVSTSRKLMKKRLFFGDDHQDEEKNKGEILQARKKRCLIKSNSIIFFQFSKKKLFTLKMIIYFSSHAICFQLFYTLVNLEILMPSINSFFKVTIYIYLISCYSF
jgi:hypothetical protein